MSGIVEFWKQKVLWAVPGVRFTDVLEIVILAFIIYQILLWIKKTRAYVLLKGLLFLFAFMVLAYVFELTTISWILEKTLSVGVIAIVIIFQPELRKALEQLGRRNMITAIFPFETEKKGTERFNDHTVDAIVRATFELGKAKTGALIVIEQEDSLAEYENTGIILDSEISSQLLVQIFEHNTPLHDGAVIIRGNRIAAATCYLPLSSNGDISKDLGTRHRAAVGISEATDSLTIIASEETGAVSLAIGGELIRAIDRESLKSKLMILQKKSIDVKRFRLWKGKGGAKKS